MARFITTLARYTLDFHKEKPMTTEFDQIDAAPMPTSDGRFVPMATLHHLLHVLGGIPAGQKIGQRQIADLFLEVGSIIAQPING